MTTLSLTAMRRALRNPRWPVFFDAPADPVGSQWIPVDATTTPRQLTIRTIFAAKQRTFPAAGLIICHQIGEALVPVIMGLAIDRAIAGHDLASLVLWLAVLGAVFAMLSFSFRFGSRIGFLGMQSIQHQLRTRVTDRILDPQGMDGPSAMSGMLLSIATADVAKLATAVAVGVYPVGELAAVIFCGVVLLWISWPLGLAILLGAPLILWILDSAGGALRGRSQHEQQLAGEAAATAEDLVAGFRVVKGVGAEDEARRRYDEASSRALHGVLRARRAEGWYLGAMELVSGLFVVAVAVAAGLMTVNGVLSIGELITVVGVTQFVMGPLGELGTDFGKIWASANASAQRVLTVLQAPPVTPVLDAAKTSVDQGVSLRCEALSVGSISGLDLDFPGGGLVAVIADHEATMALTDVFARARRPASGTVRVAGTDLFDLDHEQARRRVRVAPHATDLFEGSVLDNIGAGVEEHPESGEQIARAVYAAACDDVVEVLPDGLDTPVGEAGRRLSGGQRQRVGLARALAAESAVLVLVDPTTAVDSVTEALIAERLAAERNGRTTIVFTRSPALLAVADEVVVVDGAGARRVPADHADLRQGSTA